MEKDKIIFWRNFLFNTFVVGVLLAFLFFVVTLGFWGHWVKMTNDMFHTSEAELARLALAFFFNVRLVLLFLILAPCIALYWMTRK